MEGNQRECIPSVTAKSFQQNVLYQKAELRLLPASYVTRLQWEQHRLQPCMDNCKETILKQQYLHRLALIWRLVCEIRLADVASSLGTQGSTWETVPACQAENREPIINNRHK